MRLGCLASATGGHSRDDYAVVDGEAVGGQAGDGPAADLHRVPQGAHQGHILGAGDLSGLTQVHPLLSGRLAHTHHTHKYT